MDYVYVHIHENDFVGIENLPMGTSIIMTYMEMTYFTPGPGKFNEGIRCVSFTTTCASAVADTAFIPQFMLLALELTPDHHLAAAPHTEDDNFDGFTTISLPPIPITTSAAPVTKSPSPAMAPSVRKSPAKSTPTKNTTKNASAPMVFPANDPNPRKRSNSPAVATAQFPHLELPGWDMDLDMHHEEVDKDDDVVQSVPALKPPRADIAIKPRRLPVRPSHPHQRLPLPSARLRQGHFLLSPRVASHRLQFKTRTSMSAQMFLQ